MGWQWGPWDLGFRAFEVEVKQEEGGGFVFGVAREDGVEAATFGLQVLGLSCSAQPRLCDQTAGARELSALPLKKESLQSHIPMRVSRRSYVDGRAPWYWAGPSPPSWTQFLALILRSALIGMLSWLQSRVPAIPASTVPQNHWGSGYRRRPSAHSETSSIEL